MKSRSVEKLVTGRATSDGAGVKLTRVLTQDLQRRLDPFLMLDVFASDNRDDYIGGFPDHPHRGFETVTYMLAGRMRHHDSAGNSGLLGPGDAQWMTAGAGLVHSELPEQEDGRMEGFQLWLNLPAREKMCAPAYRDIPARDIPEAVLPGGARLRVIAGQSGGLSGAVQREATTPLFIDVLLPAGGRFEQVLPAGHNAFLYAYRGDVIVGERRVAERNMAILANDDGEGVVVTSTAPARFILLAARPLGEPIVQYGPFVMNSEAQIHAAISDYRSGAFERNSVRAD